MPRQWPAPLHSRYTLAGHIYRRRMKTMLLSLLSNLHAWVFQNAEIARVASVSAISAFWKTHKCKLNSNWAKKTVWLLIDNTNMKKFARKKCRKMFLEATFFAFENFFQSFRTKFLSLLYMISLAYKISHCLSANHNPELRCTGVTLERHCS